MATFMYFRLGQCWCGCDRPTPLLAKTHRPSGKIRGLPSMMFSGHAFKRYYTSPIRTFRCPGCKMVRPSHEFHFSEPLMACYECQRQHRYELMVNELLSRLSPPVHRCHCGCGWPVSGGEIGTRIYIEGHNKPIVIPSDTPRVYIQRSSGTLCALREGYLGDHGDTYLVHPDGTSDMAYLLAFHEAGYVIPSNSMIIHTCFHRSCENVDHMKLVDVQELIPYNPHQVPFGYCWCGCGQKTPIPKITRRSKGWIQGQPLHYILGHDNIAELSIPESNKASCPECGELKEKHHLVTFKGMCYDCHKKGVFSGQNR